MNILNYFKLDWVQNTDTIQVNSGFHGKFQNNTAMDFGSAPLIAPMDGCWISGNTGSGQQQYFNINLPINGKAYIQCVHGRPARTGTFKKGEVIGYTNAYINPTTKQRADHWHLAINVNGAWHGLMTYIRRDYKIVLNGSPWSNPYDKWSFYLDRALSVYVTAQPEVKVTPPPADVEKPFTPAPLPEPVMEGVEPQPEAITTPAEPTMPSINADIKPEISPSQKIINNLEAENTRLQNKIKELETTVEDQKTQISNLYVALDSEIKVPKTKFQIPERLRSRKLWTLIFTVAYVITANFRPELQSGVVEILTIASTYIGVEGVADIVKVNKK